MLGFEISKLAYKRNSTHPNSKKFVTVASSYSYASAKLQALIITNRKNLVFKVSTSLLGDPRLKYRSGEWLPRIKSFVFFSRKTRG
jgi:hypothetical protein